jgi:hypothetical protein
MEKKILNILKRAKAHSKNIVHLDFFILLLKQCNNDFAPHTDYWGS